MCQVYLPFSQWQIYLPQITYSVEYGLYTNIRAKCFFEKYENENFIGETTIFSKYDVFYFKIEKKLKNLKLN